MTLPLDHAFVSAMQEKVALARKTHDEEIQLARESIKVVDTVKKLQACVEGTEELSKEQLTAARILLAKVMPDLRAVEHTAAPKRPQTREELLERLATLQSGTTAGDVRRGPAGSPPTH